jgi:hypothetical protein
MSQNAISAAIPTKYAACQFRSRLEAKWAAFFDLCGWKWQYEPVDLNGYIPDFVLEFDDSHNLGRPWLIACEIKPAFSIDQMEQAMRKLDDAGWPGEALVLGATLRMPNEYRAGFNHQVFGSLRDFNWPRVGKDKAPAQVWTEAGMFNCNSNGSAREHIGFHSNQISHHCRVCGYQFGGWAGIPATDSIEKMWREAGNRVQWKAPA